MKILLLLIMIQGCAHTKQVSDSSDRENDLAQALIRYVMNECCVEFDRIHDSEDCLHDARLIMSTLSKEEHAPSEVCSLWE